MTDKDISIDQSSNNQLIQTESKMKWFPNTKPTAFFGKDPLFNPVIEFLQRIFNGFGLSATDRL
jgi:hypothetical protein